jgi:hypothetical protein
MTAARRVKCAPLTWDCPRCGTRVRGEDTPDGEGWYRFAMESQAHLDGCPELDQEGAVEHRSRAIRTQLAELAAGYPGIAAALVYLGLQLG